MRFAGFMLLLTGWGIVLTALVVLASGLPQTCFILSGIGVEVVGFVLVTRSHPIPRVERG